MKRIVVLSPILLAAALVLLGPSSALAADCGGAVPCSCGDTVIADRTLVCGVDPITNPPPCTGDGLIVADNITLNLGGCTIRGADGGVGVTLGMGSTVEAGKVVGFDTGVEVAEPNGTVRLTRISDANWAGIDVLGAGSRLDRNVLQRNAHVGILVRETGDDATVQLNRVEDSGGCGILTGEPLSPADPVTNITLLRNVVLRNDECGINLFNVVGGTVDRNKVSFTKPGSGVILDGALHLEISLNISEAADDGDPNTHTAHGFHVLATSTDNTFRKNAARSNDGYGIKDESTGSGTSGTANTYIQNNCSGNALGPSSPAGLC